MVGTRTDRNAWLQKALGLAPKHFEAPKRQSFVTPDGHGMGLDIGPQAPWRPDDPDIGVPPPGATDNPAGDTSNMVSADPAVLKGIASALSDGLDLQPELAAFAGAALKVLPGGQTVEQTGKALDLAQRAYDAVENAGGAEGLARRASGAVADSSLGRAAGAVVDGDPKAFVDAAGDALDSYTKFVTGGVKGIGSGLYDLAKMGPISGDIVSAAEAGYRLATADDAAAEYDKINKERAAATQAKLAFASGLVTDPVGTAENLGSALGKDYKAAAAEGKGEEWVGHAVGKIGVIVAASVATGGAAGAEGGAVAAAEDGATIAAEDGAAMAARRGGAIAAEDGAITAVEDGAGELPGPDNSPFGDPNPASLPEPVPPTPRIGPEPPPIEPPEPFSAPPGLFEEEPPLELPPGRYPGFPFEGPEAPVTEPMPGRPEPVLPDPGPPVTEPELAPDTIPTGPPSFDPAPQSEPLLAED